jgi:hypothetical protein
VAGQPTIHGLIEADVTRLQTGWLGSRIGRRSPQCWCAASLRLLSPASGGRPPRHVTSSSASTPDVGPPLDGDRILGPYEVVSQRTGQLSVADQGAGQLK